MFPKFFSVRIKAMGVPFFYSYKTVHWVDFENGIFFHTSREEVARARMARNISQRLDIAYDRTYGASTNVPRRQGRPTKTRTE